MEKFKKRLRNYGFWTSLIAFGGLLWKTFDPNFPNESYDEVTTAALALLVLLGIVNDPTTDSTGFLDDK